ncbi:hypothetical protein ACFX2B_040924 [Malus domestica]
MHQLLRLRALPFYLLAIMLHKMMDQRLEPQGLPFYVLAQRLDDEEDPVVMASSPLSELVKLLIRPDKKRKRKSRWDM